MGQVPRTFFISMWLLAALTLSFLSGCSKPDPVRTVQTYLQVLSGERTLTPKLLENITTRHYRDTAHPHLSSIAEETRTKAIDIASEFREDPKINEYMKRVKWTTTYDIPQRSDNSCMVIARVILSERRPGDRQAALAIPGLMQPLRDILERGLELPFKFQLKMEDGKWKIDDFQIPEVLEPLLIMD